MLDFDSEDIDGMNDDVGEEQEPPPTGRWAAISSYDIYMVDTPKENNGKDQKDATEGNPLEKQPKRPSKSGDSKNSDNSARKIDTPVDSKGNNDHMDPGMEQEEPGHAEHSLEQTPDHGDPEGRTHQPASGEEEVRTTMHSSFWKNVWNKRTSTEGLWPPRGA